MFIICAIASLFVALGFKYKFSIIIFFLSFTYIELIVIRGIKYYYEIFLRAIERKSRVIIFTSLLFIALGLALLPFFKTQFIPPLHEGHFIMHMTALPGTSEKESIRIGNLVSAKIRGISGVKSVAQWVGRSPMGADTFGTHYSEFEIELEHSDGPEQDIILEEIKGIVNGNSNNSSPSTNGFVGVNFAINTFLTERIEETISGYNASVVINLFGKDLDELDRDGQKISRLLNEIEGAKDIMLQSPPGTPQATIRLRANKIAEYGIMKSDVLEIIRTAYEGFPAAIIYDGVIPITVKVTVNKSYRDDILDIHNLPIRTSTNQIVRLGEIADISQENGRSKILHQDGKRVQTITANIDGRDISAFNKDLIIKLSDLNLGEGNYYEITGAAMENSKAREELITFSILAGFTVLLMLYIAFGSLRNLDYYLI